MDDTTCPNHYTYCTSMAQLLIWALLNLVLGYQNNDFFLIMIFASVHRNVINLRGLINWLEFYLLILPINHVGRLLIWLMGSAFTATALDQSQYWQNFGCTKLLN